MTMSTFPMKTLVFLVFGTAIPRGYASSKVDKGECDIQNNNCLGPNECSYMFTFQSDKSDSCQAGERTVTHMDGIEDVIAFLQSYESYLIRRFKNGFDNIDKWREYFYKQIKRKIARGELDGLTNVIVQGIQYSKADLRNIILYQQQTMDGMMSMLDEMTMGLGGVYLKPMHYVAVDDDQDVFYDVESFSPANIDYKTVLLVKTDSYVYVYKFSEYGIESQVQRIPLPANFGSLETFKLEGRYFVVVSGRTVAVIYEWNRSRLGLFQTIDNHPYYVREFAFTEVKVNSELKYFLYIARYSDTESEFVYEVESVIYRWDGRKFVLYQNLPVFLSADAVFITLEDEVYLLASESFFDTPASVLFKLSSNGLLFDEPRTLPTIGSPSTLAAFTTPDRETYVVVPVFWDGYGAPGSVTVVYKWNRAAGWFEEKQVITLGRVWRTCPFLYRGEQFLLVLSQNDGPVVFRLKGDFFVEHQVITEWAEDSYDEMRTCHAFELDNRVYVVVHKALFELHITLDRY